MSDANPAANTAADIGPEGAHASHGHMARWGFPIVAVIALVALFWPRSEDDRINFQAFRREMRGEAAPAGMLIDSGGRPIPLAKRMAPVTLVHFWATWCPPCIAEVPSILRLADDYTDHNFSLVMIAVQDDIEKVSTFLGDRTSEALFDHDWKLTHSYGTEKVPETHLVVRGQIVESFIGATNWDDAENRKRVDEALAQLQDNQG